MPAASASSATSRGRSPTASSAAGWRFSAAWPTAEARTALCALKTFPASKAHHAVDTLSTYTEVCRDRSDDPMTDVVIPPGVREMDNFHWINNPYQMEQSAADPLSIESPEDYLLAYWLGRYYGLITDDM